MNSDLRFIKEIHESKEKISIIYNSSIDSMKDDYINYKIEKSKQDKKTFDELEQNKIKENKYYISHPLDDEILDKLMELSESMRDDDDEYKIFIKIRDIISLWKQLIEKSIKCLRFFDKREPFIENTEKSPIAYGIEELYKYFDKYIKFESMLYGGGKYYRDHIVHMFRVWLLGIHCLLEEDNNEKYLDKISLGKDTHKKEIKITQMEKISMWTVIALTHDLGYPLEKSQKIIENTRDMMKSFVSNPMVSLDLSFNGIQNNMNDFVLRFMSSKMNLVNSKCPKTTEENQDCPNKYVARLQPKYYFKFQKSLERSMHGIISSLVIYKLLIYFLESDFNINEDYQFDEEDARQFYIRREILRSISAHTCTDIYHLDMFNFAFFLIIMDDSQDWGRKRISELYIKSKTEYDFDDIVVKFNKENTCTMSETFKFKKDNISEVKSLFQRLRSQFKNYNAIFRDGQDTSIRNFDFIKECRIETEEENRPVFTITFNITNKKSSTFEVSLSCRNSANLKNVKSKYNSDFYKEKDVFGKDVIIKEKNSDASKITYIIDFGEV